MYSLGGERLASMVLDHYLQHNPILLQLFTRLLILEDPDCHQILISLFVSNITQKVMNT